MEKLENKKYWIWLSLIRNLGSKGKQKLLKIYKTPDKIYKLEKRELLRIKGIGESLANHILDKNIRKNLENHILYMQIKLRRSKL